ncbi:hypothetical protein [Kitasatospora sp. NPDC094015]|uniref:hypothetical protein n=1 Tax=Kitasatospora sp. NPDC094015 TaxID=3155205 RepID=UPI00332F53D5
MSPGPRTRTLIRLGNAARAQRIESDHEAVARAAAALGLPAEQAEFTGEEEAFAVWSLPRADALAYVHPPERAWQAHPLMAAAHRVRDCGLDVLLPRFDRAVAGGSRFVTFWERPRGRRDGGDPSAAAYAAAAVHLLPPPPPSATSDHDPFDGLLDGLERAVLRAGDAEWIRDRSALPADHWRQLDRPTPPTTILAGRHPALCDEHRGTRQLVLTRPLLRGQRAWDLAAARWRADLLHGQDDGYPEFAAAYARFGPGLPYGGDLAPWSGYAVLREILALADTLREVRRAALGARHHRGALHRLSCLRGERGPAPWQWTVD